MQRFKQLGMGKIGRAKGLRSIAAGVVVCVVLLCLTVPALARNKYVITDGDHVVVCVSSSLDPGKVIREAGLELGETDTYTTKRQGGVSQIEINREQMIAIHDGGEMTVVGAYGGTVAEVLENLGLNLSETDVLSCSPDAETYDGMSVEITRIRVEETEYDEVVPYGTQYYEEDSLAPGEEEVLVKGINGLRHVEARISYENGVETDREILSELMEKPPVNQVVARGVDRSVKEQEHSGIENYRPSDTTQLGTGYRPSIDSAEPVLPTENFVPGTNFKYKQLKYMEATAYSCQRKDGTMDIQPTFSGTTARVGAIAVDPSVIPLGTKLYIVSRDGSYVYGFCTAEDTGGLIKGDIVDLYFDTYEECAEFGRRDVVVYILEE